jgi:four helix bundle protein
MEFQIQMEVQFRDTVYEIGGTSRHMGYRRFEELPVWKDAIELAVRIFALTSTGCLKGFAGLRDQLERAAILISNNVAEGFERGTNDELIAFLYIAKGSAGEVRSMFSLLARLPGLEEHITEVQDLRRCAESISKQIGRWIESIKDSGFKGSRSQNSMTRKANESERRREAFLARLREVQNEAQPDPPGPRSPDPTKS